MAKIMGTHSAGMKDPGTNTRGMSRYFEQKGWKVKNALKDGSPETYEKFLDFVDSNLKQGIPLMVENVDWGGHWRVIIGHDTLGDREGPMIPQIMRRMAITLFPLHVSIICGSTPICSAKKKRGVSG